MTTKVEIDPSQIDMSGVDAGASNASNSIARLDSIVSKLTFTVGSLVEKLSDFSNITNPSGGLGNVGNTFRNAYDNVKLTGDGVEDLNKSIKSANDQFNDITDKLKELSVNAIGYFAGASTAMTNFGNQGANASGKISAAFAGSAELIANMFSIPTGEIKKMISHIESTQMFESSILSMTSATGEFGIMLERAGDRFENLTSITSNYKELIKDAGDATNTLYTDVSKYASALGAVQGALSTDVFVDGHNSMNMLTAAMTVASGTGQDFSKIVEDLKNQYERFNSVGKESLAVASRIASASQSLQIPLEFVRNTVNDVSSQFLMMGNNSQAAIEILSRFAPALRESGLGPEGIRQIVSGITSGLNQMNIAQRAFLSAQAGGPGGLRGGIRVENLIREGKLDEVAKMTEEALRKQFGGRIVTSKEAEQSEALAHQHLRQRQFLMSGAFGGMAKNDAEAARLLDALSKGTFSEALTRAGTASTEQSLFENMRTGQQVQLRQWNDFTTAANLVEAARMGIGNTMYDQFRTFLGADGASRADVMMEMDKGARSSSSIKPMGDGRFITDESFKERVYDEFITGIKDIFSRVSQNISSEISKIAQESIATSNANNLNPFRFEGKSKGFFDNLPSLSDIQDKVKSMFKDSVPQSTDRTPSHEINSIRPISYFDSPESSRSALAPVAMSDGSINHRMHTSDGAGKQVIELNMEMHCPQCHASTYKHIAEAVFDSKSNEDRGRINMGAVLV